MILLTGATGYLGSNLLRTLVTKGYEVVALKRATSNSSRWQSIEGDFEQYNLDDGIENIFNQYPITNIIHTATSYGRKGESKAQVLEANLIFPLRLLEAGVKNGLEAFYNTSTSLPGDLNPYARSKCQFDDWLDLYASDIKVAHLVPEYFYGPGDDSTKFITMLIEKMKDRNGNIDLSPCTQQRDFFYIDDLVDGFMCLIENEKYIKSSTRFSIGSGAEVSLKELVLQLAELTEFNQEQLSFGALPLRDNEVMHSKADLDNWKEFKWSPKISLKEGLLKTINN